MSDRLSKFCSNCDSNLQNPNLKKLNPHPQRKANNKFVNVRGKILRMGGEGPYNGLEALNNSLSKDKNKITEGL